jgi:beta-galactosidase
MNRTITPDMSIIKWYLEYSTLKYAERILIALLFLLFALNTYAQESGSTSLFNNNWKFYKGDVGHGEDVNFNDKGWRQINLPHDWSIEGTFSRQWASGTAFLPAGIGWYRKTFIIPSSGKRKKVYIYFDGVYKNSEVWLNGHYLGKRPNGFVSFQYELTPYLNFEGTNVLAVKVDHSQFADSRWYTGSGIYRNVYLIVKQPLHIAQWGVAVTTPEVSEVKATVEVSVTMVNASSKNSNITLTCKLVNADHQTIALASKSLNLKSSDSSITGLTLNVKNPKLWSVDYPKLYNLVVSLTADGQQTDVWEGNVGIRNVRFDADMGFFVNGKNMKLKGVCLHDDAGALGVAVPKEVWCRRLKLLKDGGCNAIRMSHNPHADYFYDLCDKLGLLVMDEAFDEWEIGKNKWVEAWNTGIPANYGYHEYFREWYDRDLGDLVRRDRNHASIIMWSIGNESDYPNDPYSDPVLNTGRNPQIYGNGYLPDHPPAKRLGELSKLLADVIKRYDTSRPVTAALAGVVMSNNTTFPVNLDVVGYNYQEYRYSEDHKTYPKRIIYGSENGMQLSNWISVDTNAYIAGQYLWTGIDYLGESHKWPAHGNAAGLIDMAGFPKPEYYFRQSLWSDKPMIYIGTQNILTTAGDSTSNRFRHQAKPDWNYRIGDKVRVDCFTNCTEAELFLNGRSLGKKILSRFYDRIIYWDVDYQSGELVVKGTAKDGSKVSHSLQTTGEPYAISATEAPFRQSGGVSQIIIHVVDKNGHTVYGSDNELTIKVSGNAKLMGIENGDIADNESYQSNSRKVFNGNLLAFVQPDNKTAIISVTVESPGLKSTTWQTQAIKP